MAFLFLLTGCLNQAGIIGGKEAASIDAANSKGFAGFQGCVQGTPIDTSRIRITFQFPSQAEEVFVKRNGVTVFSTRSKSSTNFIDSGLSEEETYEYTCEAFIDEEVRVGSNKLSLKTLTGNAPQFSGISDVTESSNGDTITVSWTPTSGPLVGYFKIFANPGPSINWNQAPITTVSTEGALSRLLSNNRSGITDLIANAASFNAADQIILDRIYYGDNLEYHFGVRACTSSNICDSNTKTLKLSGNKTKPKAAPLGPGIRSASFVNGKLIIDVPWKHQYGNVKNRRVYFRKFVGAAWSTWTEALNVTVSNPHLGVVPTSITVEREGPGLNFDEYRDYEFKVIDVNEDLGSNSAYTRVVALNSGDLTPPVFDGLASVTPGSNTGLLPETSAKFSFNASTSIDIDKYEIYYTTGYGGDACNNGTLLYSEAATGFAGASTITLGAGDPATNPGALISITPRTRYTFCMKAVDTSSNSTGVVTYNYSSKDLTPPYFNRPNIFLAPGLNSVELDRDTKKLMLAWGATSESDIRSYKVNIWQGSASTAGLLPPDGSNANGFWIKDLEVLHPSISTAIDLPMGDVIENSMLYVSIAACDDAGVTTPAFNTTNNCTDKSLIDPWSDSDAYLYYLGDLTPPAGFSGITTASLFIDKDLNGSADLDETDHGGTATVTWTLPGNISDYHQLEVVHLDQAFNRVKLPNTVTGRIVNCYDSAGTWTCPTSTVLKGLDQYRRYRFHVIARDAVLNPTEDMSNAYYPQDADPNTKTLDTVAPKFPINENGTADSKFKFKQITDTNIVFEWVAATDNQYDSAARVYYEVYRKLNSAFNGTTLAGATKVLDLPNTFEHSESKGSLNQGDTYYYLVCARDESANRNCPGTSVAYTVPDTVAPVLNLVKARNIDDTLDKTSADKKWILSWSLSDNSSLNNTRVIIFYKRSEATSADSRFTLSEAQVTGVFERIFGQGTLPSLPTGVSFVVATPGSTPCSSIAGGSDDSTSSMQRLNCVLGPTDNIFGKKEWFSYYVVARDSDGVGNFSSSSLPDFTQSNAAVTVESNNTVTVSKVLPGYISKFGNTKILIQGVDFGNQVTVTLKNGATVVPCGNIERITSGLVSCEIGDYTAPAAAITPGSYSVIVTNSDGSRNQDSVWLEISEPTNPNVSKCSSAADLASDPFHSGAGVLGDPYIICSAEQMVALMSDSTLWAAGHFKIGKHLDFSSIDEADIQPIGQGPLSASCGGGNNLGFGGNFDGGNYLIQNFTKNFTNTVGCRLGIFGSLIAGAVIKNIIFQNLTLRQTTAQAGTGTVLYLGIIGYIGNTSATVSGIQIYDALVETDFTGIDYIATLVARTVSSSQIQTFSDIIMENVQVKGKAADTTGNLSGGVFGFLEATHASSLVSNIKLKNVTVDSSTATAGGDAGIFAARLNGIKKIRFVKIEDSNLTCGYNDDCGGFSYSSTATADIKYLKMKNINITSTGNNGGRSGGIFGSVSGTGNQMVALSDFEMENIDILYSDSAGAIAGYSSAGSASSPTTGGVHASRIKVKNFKAVAKTDVGGFVGYFGNVTNSINIKESSIIGGTLQSVGTGYGGGFFGNINGTGTATSLIKYFSITNSMVDLQINLAGQTPGAFFGRIRDSSAGSGAGYVVSNSLSLARRPNLGAMNGFIGVPDTVVDEASGGANFSRNYWSEELTQDASTSKTFGTGATPVTVDGNMFTGRLTVYLQDQTPDPNTYIGWNFNSNPAIGKWMWDMAQSLYPVPRMTDDNPEAAPAGWTDP